MKTATPAHQRIFSGIQPTGHLHLGNYLGAIRNWVALQDAPECIYCIVDLHAITIFQDPLTLQNSIRDMAACVLACGLDARRHILFAQSMNTDHATLAWIFNCVARMGWLNRMTQFKDKAGKNRERASTGLFVYPNLMAADILAYGATHVPVGEDQKQHLELTRDIAQKFNLDWDAKNFFPIVDPIIPKEAARIMSLRDGSKKMSKSDPSPGSRIHLQDSPQEITKKIQKAKTDPHPIPDNIAELHDRPEARNLLQIYSIFTNQSLEASLQEFGGQNFSQFKPLLADCIIAELAPISDALAWWQKNPQEIDRVLQDGAMRAHAISHPIITAVSGIIGLGGGLADA
ncbi:MAG: tryptophan--tRNA ligase [Pseudomonadota bacterium]